MKKYKIVEQKFKNRQTIYKPYGLNMYDNWVNLCTTSDMNGFFYCITYQLALGIIDESKRLDEFSNDNMVEEIIHEL
jgi:hypothetical protein